MRRKSLFVFALVLVLFSLPSCKSNPEQGLLAKYFNAMTLKDVMTMSTMALEPMTIDWASWKILKVSEEQVVPASLPDVNKLEMDSKKTMDGHVTPTLEAKDAVDIAKDEYDSARTAAAKAAAKKKVDDAQKKFDEETNLHNELKKAYNEAKAAATREEDSTSFSLGEGQLASIRDLKGTVHSKDVEVEVKAKAGTITNYRFYLRMYRLKDEALNLPHNGRWVIVKQEQL
jgi:hypothetical protein